jgi:poly(A) polymerase
VYVILSTVMPQIIPRKEHRISRKQVSPNALRTLYRLHSRGFIAFLVGGCVRDLLLGRTPKDFDIGTDATPNQIKRLFRNCRLIGRRFRLAHLHFQDEIVEVSTFRRDAAPSDNTDAKDTDSHKHFPRHIKNEDGMVLADNIFGTPEEDALRRDFTINALAYNIADFSVIDYSTGLTDLRQQIIRSIGDPYVRFTEDPVRMLRAVRFAASHDFVIEPAAWENLCELSCTISRVSPARLFEEIQKLFLLGSARPAFGILEKSGLFNALFPGFGNCIYENNLRTSMLNTKLEYLDNLFRGGTPVSLALFLAALFGPYLEKAAFGRHRDGTPHQQAMNETCSIFMEEISKIISIPKRVGVQLRSILALQTFLHRMPPKRPASIANKPEFREALIYLLLGAETRKENKISLEWWNAFLSGNPSKSGSGSQTDEVKPKKRRKRRRKPRRFRKPLTENLSKKSDPDLADSSLA